MYSKNRMTLKKELKAIAKSTDIMDKEEYTYFMENVKIGFTDLEIVNMIYNLLSGYLYQKDDFEYKIADFLFTQLTIISSFIFVSKLTGNVPNLSGFIKALLRISIGI